MTDIRLPRHVIERLERRSANVRNSTQELSCGARFFPEPRAILPGLGTQRRFRS
jgi:hypothetical protein